MKKLVYICTISFISLLFFSCEKEISIVQQPYNEKPSIQCLITPGQYPKLYLNKTLPFLTPPASAREIFIDNATVTITGGGDEIPLVSNSVLDNFYGTVSYFYSGTTKIRENTEYTLKIIYKGKVFAANTTTNQRKVQIDSITYIDQFKDIYGEHEGVVFHFKDPPGELDNYRYEMQRLVDSTTYAVNDFKSPVLMGSEKALVIETGRSMYNDVNFDGGSYSFVMEPAFKHKAGDTTFVYLQNCDKNIFDFYNELDKQKLTQKNPFIEPVFLRTNQFKDAIGVFGSYALSDSILFVYPE